MNLTFTGGREFARFLQKLPGAVSAEILETSLMAGGQIIVERAREKCPKPAERRRPGTVRLSDSIRATPVEKDAAHAIVNVGTNVPYAHLVEYGHQIIPRGPGRQGLPRSRKNDSEAQAALRRNLRIGLNERRASGSRGFVAARPFLRPAFDESREAVVRRIGEVMGKEIEVAARRIANTASRAA